MKRIKIVFSPTGEASVEAFGFSGRDCLKATEAIERAIGLTAVRKDKPEMAMSAQEQTISQGGR